MRLSGSVSCLGSSHCYVCLISPKSSLKPRKSGGKAAGSETAATAPIGEAQATQDLGVANGTKTPRTAGRQETRDNEFALRPTEGADWTARVGEWPRFHATPPSALWIPGKQNLHARDEESCKQTSPMPKRKVQTKATALQAARWSLRVPEKHVAVLYGEAHQS